MSAGFVPSTWAMPCVPVAGINMGVFTVPPIGAGRVDRVRARRPRLSRSGSAATGAVPPRCRSRATRAAWRQRHHAADHAEERHSSSATCPADRRHPHPDDARGAMISVSDVGIIISNGKGAVINMTGPTVDVNLGALDGDLGGWTCLLPSCTSAPRSCARTPARRRRWRRFRA